MMLTLVLSARSYYRILVRTDLDRRQLRNWMNVGFTRMLLDWELLRREENDWIRYQTWKSRDKGAQ